LKELVFVVSALQTRAVECVASIESNDEMQNCLFVEIDRNNTGKAVNKIYLKLIP